MQKTPEGPVIYDSDLCMGCRYCLVACPYGIPRYEWDTSAPLVRKCTMCYPRIQEGKEPACVEACPEDALLFGEREDLLVEAHRRIGEQPGVYLDHVFGETEVGGTAVLYLADISLGFLAWEENLGDGDLPHLTWASLKKVPGVMLGMGGLMGGIYWVINRRMRLAARAADSAMALDGVPAPGGGEPRPETMDAPPQVPADVPEEGGKANE
jgi:formate dehydrogenase iron-sulfur subunit